MTLDANALRKLAALGLDTEQMAGVLDVLASMSEEDEARKAAQRERTRRSREKAVVTLQSRHGNSYTSVTPLPDKEIPPTPPKETNPTPIQNEETNVSSQKRGSRIPDDFEPDLIWAQSQGISPSQATSEALKFRDYWRGKTQNATKLDWPATWRNWVRAALERLPQARASPAAFPAKDTTANAANRRLELIRNERTRSEVDDYQSAVGLISRYPERGVG